MKEATLRKTLKENFGYEAFRPLQQEIIEAVFRGEDNLVIMPTGGGKSICFQLPALLFPGVTLVISPLIALMKDQVDGLRANGIAAAFFNSTQSQDAHQDIFSQLEANQIRLLYVAPESLSALEQALQKTPPSLIAIDEAHCISSWGHDFRPAYTQLGYLKKRYPKTPVIALTATADKATRQDICQQLNIPNATQHVASFDRKNLSLEVRPGIKKFEFILKFIGQRRGESGIIYCLSRKNTESLAAKLQAKGISAAAYHAGLEHQEREKIQEKFINDQKGIICATIAFGMGIDKSNIRWVVHYNLPKNLEGYYQEIGRAGRDGLPSSTLLFHSYADVIQLQKFAANAGNAAVQLAKLDRMKQYAEALSCRRKILLNYFGEGVTEDCGNCDMCKNPPQFFDGTILAQKALSTVFRLEQKEPLSVVIDVLRGAQNSLILEKNYSQLSTYGIGKDISWKDWQHYLIQLVNQGYLEIVFHEQNSLRLTDLARPVLFKKKTVRLAQVQDSAFPTQTMNQPQEKGGDLFERLRSLRLFLAKKEGIPAYLIFSDASLREMEEKKPLTDEAFSSINGVGIQKMKDYGYQFLKEIRSFTEESDRPKSSAKKKGKSLHRTLALHQEGLEVHQIAQSRKLSPATVVMHLIKLYEEGEKVDLRNMIPASDLDAVKQAREELGRPNGLKIYFEHFQEALDYHTIRIALCILKQEESSQEPAV